MPDNSTAPAKPPVLALRQKEFQLPAGEWPCAADLLNRAKEVENLSPVLLNAEAPLVFAIDAPWGGGKTTFIRLWQHYLNNQGRVSLYLNAWENDFAEDPLLPMLSVLDRWLTEHSNKPAVKAAWEKAKSYAPGILKSTAVAAAKAATLGALDLDKEYEKLAAELSGGAVGSLVDSFNVKQKSLEQFRVQLQAALEALPEDQPNLIIFVDELDRCKPTYAIDVLERIKHLFDIERLVFVLAVNRDQLSKSLKGVYGSEFDGLHYLKRFIDLDYQLRVPDLATYIDAQMNRDDIAESFRERGREKDHHRWCADMLKPLARRFDYSLRDVDQFFTRWRLILRSIPATHYIDVHILAPMMILRQQNEPLYRRFVADASVANEVIEFLFGSAIDELYLNNESAVMAGALIAENLGNVPRGAENPLLARWEALYQHRMNQNQRLGGIDRVLEIAGNAVQNRMRYGVRKLACERIDLVSQIEIA